MDPETLGYKRTVKVAEDYNILSIDYMEASDQYVIQTDAQDGYSFKILNSDFELVEEMCIRDSRYPGSRRLLRRYGL